MKKILVLSLLMVIGLSGCGGSGAKQITFSWWGSNDRNNATLQAIEDYNASQDEVEIVPEYYDYASYETKLTTEIAGGAEACLMQVDYHWPENYGLDKFVDLNEYSDVLGLDGYSQDILDTMTLDDKLIALPSGPNVPIFIFNKTTFEEAGLEVPTSWEELEQSGQKMQVALGENYYPFSTLMARDLTYEYTYQKTGVPLIDEDGNYQWGREEVLVGYDEWKKLIDNNVVPSAEQAPKEMVQGDPQWISGEWAGAITWTGSVSSWDDSLAEGQELVVVPTLTMEGAKTSGKIQKPAMSYAISSNCEYKEETAEFLAWFVSSEQATKDLGLTRGMVSNPEAIQILEDNDMLTGVTYDAYISTKDLETAPMPILSEDVTQVFLDNLDSIRYGSKTPEEAADETLAVLEEQ